MNVIDILLFDVERNYRFILHKDFDIYSISYLSF